MQDGTCVVSDEISSPTQLAVQFGGGSSGTILASTGSVSSTASSTGSSLSNRLQKSLLRLRLHRLALLRARRRGLLHRQEVLRLRIRDRALRAVRKELPVRLRALLLVQARVLLRLRSLVLVVGAGVFGLVEAVGFVVGILETEFLSASWS
jgi:hypothetical protein